MKIYARLLDDISNSFIHSIMKSINKTSIYINYIWISVVGFFSFVFFFFLPFGSGIELILHLALLCRAWIRLPAKAGKVAAITLTYTR